MRKSIWYGAVPRGSNRYQLAVVSVPTTSSAGHSARKIREDHTRSHDFSPVYASTSNIRSAHSSPLTGHSVRTKDDTRSTSITNVVDLTSTALRLIELYGPLAVMVFTFLEASMLFPFLPSEIVVPAAAALLVQDIMSFVVFVGAAGFGGTVGAIILFYVFHGPRSGWIDQLKDYAHLSDETIERSRHWFLKWGASTVLWGRFLPGLRSVISIPAGLFRMNPLWFGSFTALGTIGFYATVAAVVYFLQQRSLFEVLHAFATDHPAFAILSLLGVLAASGVVTILYRRATEQ